MKVIQGNSLKAVENEDERKMKDGEQSNKGA
jgi:hypothetical protein